MFLPAQRSVKYYFNYNSAAVRVPDSNPRLRAEERASNLTFVRQNNNEQDSRRLEDLHDLDIIRISDSCTRDRDSRPAIRYGPQRGIYRRGTSYTARR